MKKSLFLVLLIGFFIFISTSCKAEQSVSLNFERDTYIVSPGNTIELVCRISLVDADHFTKKSLKRFGAEPVVSISDSKVELLSFKHQILNNEIKGLLTVKSAKNRLSGRVCKINIEWGELSAGADILTKKDPALFITSNGIITDPESYDALINKKRRLPEDYIPPDLVEILTTTVLEFSEVNLLRQTVANALLELVNDAKKENIEILARSGYRSYMTQKDLFDYYVKRDGEELAMKFSAAPGTSEHQSGLAVDVTSPSVNYQLVQSYGQTIEGIWLKENAHNYGFIIRYLKNKEEITGYAYEPWHLRYVGKDAAKQIFLEDLCLEEYFEK